MKLLFDCDVVIDIWGKTDDFLASYAAFDTALTRNMQLCISAASLSNVTYILAARKYLPRDKARQAIGSLMQIFETMDVSTSDCISAFESAMEDFEDALTAFGADRNGVDFVITRNKRDFAHSPVPALTPKEFLQIYQPDYLEYAIVDF